MKTKKKLIILVVTALVFVFSFFIADIFNVVSTNLPLSVLSIVCTILLATLAVPSFLGLSDSKVFQALSFIVYNRPIHYLFPIYQATQPNHPT